MQKAAEYTKELTDPWIGGEHGEGFDNSSYRMSGKE